MFDNFYFFPAKTLEMSVGRWWRFKLFATSRPNDRTTPAFCHLLECGDRYLSLRPHTLCSKTRCSFLGPTLFSHTPTSENQSCAREKKNKSPQWPTRPPHPIRQISSPPASRTRKLISRTNPPHPPCAPTLYLTIGLCQTQRASLV